tara:strand:+ start:187 stop:1257 length:1071 start_codon:yes stop_codon:yes gene_type:complete
MKLNNFWDKKRVLLTGHTGFKGSWMLLWLLNLNAKVTGFSIDCGVSDNLFSQIYPSIKDDFTHKLGDINDFENLKTIVKKFKPDIVFHFAAQALVRESYINPLETWETNVLGSLKLLNALNNIENNCSVVMITTDKVYKNNEWIYGYREIDSLGGHDPYSASKAAAELAINSWRNSFAGNKRHQKPNIFIASARSGNVIGGGDWSKDRIFPDAIRALINQEKILVRNKESTRPWQHVLDPLFGYLTLAEKLSHNENKYCDSFNFGPGLQSNKSVEVLVETILTYWNGSWEDLKIKEDFHEAGLLNLNIDKANKILDWRPKWDFQCSVQKTVEWYKNTHAGQDPYQACLKDIYSFIN